MSRQSRLKKRIRIADGIQIKESLTNTKPWFNGTKTFSSVKVNPAPIKDPNVLEVSVVDSVSAEGGLV